MIRLVADRFLFRAALAALLLCPLGSARSETLVSSDLHTRLTLGFRVSEAALQRWLPPGWQSNALGTGPAKGANLLLSFVERLQNLDPEGKLIGTGRDRYLAFAAPARQVADTQTAVFILRVYTGNPRNVPGPYNTAALVDVFRERTDRGGDVEPGVAKDAWKIQDGTGGLIELNIQYRRGTLSRAATDMKFTSPVQSDLVRIYRTQAATDTVRSVSLEVDRVDSIDFQVRIAELQELFDGSEQLLSITDSPWSTREIFRP